jgi:hypothetical protein
MGVGVNSAYDETQETVPEGLPAGAGVDGHLGSRSQAHSGAPDAGTDLDKGEVGDLVSGCRADDFAGLRVSRSTVPATGLRTSVLRALGPRAIWASAVAT